VSIREYRWRLLFGGLARPDSIGYWIGEQIRMRRNAHSGSKSAIRSTVSAPSLLTDLFPGDNRIEELLRESSAVYNPLVQRVQVFYQYDGNGRAPSLVDAADAGFLFSLCRLIRPSVVVETGVSDGVSSSMILAALSTNGHGRLISIDFPLLGIPRLYGLEPGWIIPEELRGRWTLVKGESRRLLPDVLARFNSIDVFFHDSEHSYACMFNEFVHAMHAVRPGGVIVSDDGWVNSALVDANVEVFGSAPHVLFTTSGLGVVRVPQPQPEILFTDTRRDSDAKRPQ
jgi:predicted O-methyltransferase YrrM